MTDRGTGPLTSEQIYDALLDDEAFAVLPGLLAKSVGARSTSLGWRHLDGGFEVFGHSGYFRDADMQDYAENYADVDVWALSALPADRRNRVWNVDDLVSDEIYRGSRFFNDWIKGMGDDTYHCLGSSIVGQYGAGIVGLHRGRGAERFDGGEVDTLRAVMPDLQRMLSVRGRIRAATHSATQMAGMLDAINMCMVAVDGEGRLVHANREGEAALARGRPLKLRAGQVSAAGPGAARLAAAVLAATARTAPTASTVRLDTVGAAGVATVVPHRGAGGRRQALLLLPPPAQGMTERLKEGFRLTGSEAEIAVLIAEGASPAEIADRRGTSAQTVRSQMKAVFGKMQCDRQSQVAALVSRLTLLAER